MILLELKHYIKHHQQVTLTDIKHHFDLSEEAALGLLAPLLKQGHIQSLSFSRCATGHCLSSCSHPSVHQSNNPSYQWMDQPIQNLSIPVQVR